MWGRTGMGRLGERRRGVSHEGADCCHPLMDSLDQLDQQCQQSSGGAQLPIAGGGPIEPWTLRRPGSPVHGRTSGALTRRAGRGARGAAAGGVRGDCTQAVEARGAWGLLPGPCAGRSRYGKSTEAGAVTCIDRAAGQAMTGSRAARDGMSWHRGCALCSALPVRGPHAGSRAWRGSVEGTPRPSQAGTRSRIDAHAQHQHALRPGRGADRVHVSPGIEHVDDGAASSTEKPGCASIGHGHTRRQAHTRLAARSSDVISRPAVLHQQPTSPPPAPCRRATSRLPSLSGVGGRGS